MKNIKVSIITGISSIVFIGLLSNALLFENNMKKTIEYIVIDDSRLEVVAFLRGVINNIDTKSEVLNSVNLKSELPKDDQLLAILQKANAVARPFYSFSIEKICIYDITGKIISSSNGSHNPIDIKEKYKEIFITHSFVYNEDIEQATDESTGVYISKTQIALPFLSNGNNYGIEAEINLNETLVKAESFHKKHDVAFIYISAFSSIISLLCITFFSYFALIKPLKIMQIATNNMPKKKAQIEIVNSFFLKEFNDFAININKMGQAISNLKAQEEELYFQSLKSLVMALEAKNITSSSHSARVAKYAVRLGQKLNLKRRDLDLLKRGAIMHDVGKIGIPDAILNHSGTLNYQEQEVLQNHVELGARIMYPLTRFKPIVEIVKYHHERWDGNGYPHGLLGANIPLLARIVSIADTWDTLTSDKHGNNGLPKDKALVEIENEINSGKFDPDILKVFIAMLKEGELY